MRVLDARDTAGVLPYGPLSLAIAQVLRDKAAGLVKAPARLNLDLPGGASLLAMPVCDDRLAVIKVISIHPGNAAKGLPVTQAEVLVMRADSGERVCLLDGATLTARRTAAASLLAARLLAPEPAGPLLVIGAGAQARAHAQAFMRELGVGEAYVHSPTTSKAQALADELGVLGRASVVSDPAQVLNRVNLIVTATTSPVPVMPDMVRPEAFIAAVGSFKPNQAEVPAGLVRRARVYVDALEEAREEAGDLILADVDWSRVTPLEQTLDSTPAKGGPVLYKSVGHAVLDLAAARLAVRQLS